MQPTTAMAVRETARTQGQETLREIRNTKSEIRNKFEFLNALIFKTFSCQLVTGLCDPLLVLFFATEEKEKKEENREKKNY